MTAWNANSILTLSTCLPKCLLLIPLHHQFYYFPNSLRHRENTIPLYPSWKRRNKERVKTYVPGDIKSISFIDSVIQCRLHQARFPPNDEVFSWESFSFRLQQQLWKCNSCACVHGVWARALFWPHAHAGARKTSKQETQLVHVIWEGRTSEKVQSEKRSVQTKDGWLMTE